MALLNEDGPLYFALYLNLSHFLSFPSLSAPHQISFVYSLGCTTIWK